mgnify:CR=1 FL=1
MSTSSAGPAAASPSPVTAGGALTRLFTGMGYPWRAARFALAHPRLLPLCLAPVLTAGVGLWGLVLFASRLADWAAARISCGSIPSPW